MGLMLSRLWLLRRRALGAADSTETQRLFDGCEEERLDEGSGAINGFATQVPSAGVPPIQRLPQDLFLK